MMFVGAAVDVAVMLGVGLVCCVQAMVVIAAVISMTSVSSFNEAFRVAGMTMRG